MYPWRIPRVVGIIVRTSSVHLQSVLEVHEKFSVTRKIYIKLERSEIFRRHCAALKRFSVFLSDIDLQEQI